jgi:hypothetical protein
MTAARRLAVILAATRRKTAEQRLILPARPSVLRPMIRGSWVALP